jgi:micrococcal nuclease
MYKYKAKLVRVIDGDTLDAMIDLGFNTWVKKRIRLSSINAFETRTRNKEIKRKGLAAKARVVEILEQNNNEFLLISHGLGKYGRCLGELHIEKNYIKSEKYEGKIINELLVEEGHAVKYK